MKSIKNRVLAEWLREYRYNCPTFAAALRENGAAVTTQAVWGWIVNGRHPQYSASFKAFNKLLKKMGDCRTAESFFKKKI